MRSQILELLSRGAKNETELAAFFGAESILEVMESIELMMAWGLVSKRSRQIHEGNNVFHWDQEYIFQVDVAA